MQKKKVLYLLDEIIKNTRDKRQAEDYQFMFTNRSQEFIAKLKEEHEKLHYNLSLLLDELGISRKECNFLDEEYKK